MKIIRKNLSRDISYNQFNPLTIITLPLIGTSSDPTIIHYLIEIKYNNATQNHWTWGSFIKGVGSSNVVDVLYTVRSYLELLIPLSFMIGMSLGELEKAVLLFING